jgi:D-alanyl-D-alanine carboxypeptidase
MRPLRAVCLSVGLLAMVGQPTSAQDVTGTWQLAVDLGAGGGGEATFVLVQHGAEISGTYDGAYGTGVPVEGTVEDARVRFSFVAARIGEVAYEGAIDGEAMAGTVTYGTLANGTFQGKIAATVAPIWGDALIAKVDSLGQATLAQGSAAGMSIGVQRGGEVLLARGYGLADIENGVPATPETVYRIGSLTKQFTAASIMQLVEAGKIGLGDPMTEYLPDYPMQGHVVTIRHLLTHTSGIKSYTGMESWRSTMKVDLTDEELIDMFSTEPFDFAPGERYLYDNSGFFLLGVIIGKVSAEDYPDYLDDHVFGPLGLEHSTYCDERRIIPGRAEGYEYVRGALLNDEYLSMHHPGAAGALCSTVPDLLAWSRDLRSGRVVSVDSYRQMTTSGRLNDGSQTGYGFGLGLGALVGHPSVSHTGGINGFNTALAYYPDDDLDVVVLSNTPGPHVTRIAETVAKWALGLDVPSVADEPITPQEIAAYVGVYRLAPNFDLTVFERNGQLWTQATGQGAARIRSQGNGRFVPTFDDRVWLEFETEDGAATTLILFQGGRREAPRVE